MNPALCSNHFQVDWGGRRIGFVSVSGLSTEVDTTPWREGASRDGAVRMVPGLQRFAPVVLTRAIEPGDNEFFEWMNTVRGSEAERRDVSISLLNASHEPVVTWKLRAAFPARLDYGPLNALGSDIATESLTLVHEGLAVQHAS
jgi:phage tail-like protein